MIPIIGEGFGAPKGDVVVGGAGEEIPLLALDGVLHHPGIAHILGGDGIVEGGIGSCVRAHLSWIPSLGSCLVRIKGLAMDSME